MNDLPDIIRNIHDGVRFCYWLADHPKVACVQGWPVIRLGNGVPSHFGEHYADAEFVWSERAAMNDWIRTYRSVRLGK